jgi:MFS family permease
MDRRGCRGGEDRVSSNFAKSSPANAEWKSHWPLALAAAAGFSLHSLATQSIGLFLEPMERSLHWGRGEIAIGLAIAAFLTVPLSPFVGAAIDRWGSRRLGLPGIVLTALAIAAFGAARTLPQWIALWVLYALISLGIKATVWTAAVSDAFCAARGMALAFAISGTAITQVLAPPVTNWLIEHYGWRQAWVWLGLGWAAPVFLLALFFLVDLPRKGAVKRAVPGEPVAPLAADGTFTGLDIREAIRSAALWRIGISTLLTMLLGTAAVVHQVPILTQAGVSRDHAALLASLSGLAAFARKFIVGWLMDRMNAVRISGWILAGSALGFVLLLQPLLTPTTIVLAMLVIGFAGGAKLQITAYLTGRYGGLRNFGKFFGVMHGLTVLGAGLGPLLAGYVYDISGSYTPFLVFGIPSSIICGMLIFGLGPLPEERQIVPLPI